MYQNRYTLEGWEDHQCQPSIRESRGASIYHDGKEYITEQLSGDYSLEAMADNRNCCYKTEFPDSKGMIRP